MLPRTISSLALAMLIASSALAQTVPAGWSLSGDTYTHAASGITCPATVAGYAFKSIAVPADPGFEGVCTYDKGNGETGILRLRHYVEGAGETPLAIQNDYGLMHPDEAGTPAKLLAAFRGGPGPVVDGVQTYQIVLTEVSKGYLVDCIARHTDKAMPSSDFPSACLKLAS